MCPTPNGWSPRSTESTATLEVPFDFVFESIVAEHQFLVERRSDFVEALIIERFPKTITVYT